MPLHWSPTQTIDSSPCCKSGPSSGPPQMKMSVSAPDDEHVDGAPGTDDPGTGVKLNQWAFVDRWRLRQQTDVQLCWHHCSFHCKVKVTQCLLACGRSKGHHTAAKIVTYFEEIVINFEIINKQLFSVVGLVFKPDRCSFIDKRFEMLIFINCDKYFKHWLFFYKYWSVCWFLTAQMSE